MIVWLILFCLLVSPAFAQTGTPKTNTQLNTEIQSQLLDNNTGAITPAITRQVLVDIVASGTNSSTGNVTAKTIDGTYQADSNSIDCTGATDSAAALTALITAAPNTSAIHFPTTCTVLLKSTITISDRVGLRFFSDADQRNTSGAPQFLWGGAANGVMFDVEHSDHISFKGFHFGVNTNTVNSFIKFDGEGGTHPGTLPEVSYSDFNASGQHNSSFVAIDLSPTATHNWENSYFHENTITCGTTADAPGTSTAYRAKDIQTTNAGASITSTSGTTIFSTGTFVAGSGGGGDVGRPVIISYPGYVLSTTIASVPVNGGTSATLAANNTITLNGTGTTAAQLTNNGYYGIGIHQGANQNAKHTRIWGNQITNCSVSVKIDGGSVDIDHLGGGFGATGVLFSSSSANTESERINDYNSEGDFRGIETHAGNAPFMVTNTRIANQRQLADGFLKFGGTVTLIDSGTNSTGNCGDNNANQVLVGENHSQPMILTSIANQFQCSSYALAGYYNQSFTNYSGLTYGRPHSINDNISSSANSIIDLGGGDGDGGGNQARIRLGGAMSFSTLPTCNAANKYGAATIIDGDCTTANYTSNAASGSAVCRVLCNGTNWVYQ